MSEWNWALESKTEALSFNRLKRLVQFFTGVRQPASFSEMNDDALAECAQRDPEAFAELYQRFLPRVYAYHLVHTGSVVDAQDLTSQTFEAALARLSTLRERSSVGAWLLGIARHKRADLYRRERNVTTLDDGPDLRAPHPGVEETVEQSLTLAQLHAAIAKIAPERAEALTLRVFAGLSAAEAGRVMRRSEGAIRNLVYRALQDIRREMNPAGADLEEV